MNKYKFTITTTHGIIKETVLAKDRFQAQELSEIIHRTDWPITLDVKIKDFGIASDYLISEWEAHVNENIAQKVSDYVVELRAEIEQIDIDIDFSGGEEKDLLEHGIEQMELQIARLECLYLKTDDIVF